MNGFLYELDENTNDCPTIPESSHNCCRSSTNCRREELSSRQGITSNWRAAVLAVENAEDWKDQLNIWAQT